MFLNVLVLIYYMWESFERIDLQLNAENAKWIGVVWHVISEMLNPFINQHDLVNHLDTGQMMELFLHLYTVTFIRMSNTNT